MRKIFLFLVILFSFCSCGAVQNADIGEKSPSFKVLPLEGYKVEYLPSGDGIYMKKWVDDVMCEDEDGKEYKCGYRVEIAVLTFENAMKWKNISEYVNEKYPGYTLEFVDFGGLSGVYVDETVGGKDAIRHFFVINKSGDLIYDAYLKVPSIYYGRHKDGFDEFTKKIVIL